MPVILLNNRDQTKRDVKRAEHRRARCRAVLVNTDLTALSNMPLIHSSRVLAGDDERSNDDFWIKDDFAPTPIMSTYLLAFVVADFRRRETTGHAGLKVTTTTTIHYTCRVA